MPELIAIFALTILFFIRKLVSEYFLSPSGVIIGTWLVFLILKLIFAPDYFFSFEASIYITVYLFCFFAGDMIMSFYSRHKKQKPENEINELKLFMTEKVRKRMLLLTSSIGFVSILGSLLYLKYFIDYFGSFIEVLTAGWLLRGALSEIQIPFWVKMLLLINYSGMIISIIYYIYYKFNFLLILPMLSVIIMGVTQAGRAGLFIVIFQIFIAVFWKAIISNKKEESNSKIGNEVIIRSNPEKQLAKASYKLVAIIAIIFFLGEIYRAQSSIDDYINGSGNSGIFKQYLFSGMAGFTVNLENPEFFDLGYGRYNFSSLYDLLGIAHQEVGIYTKYVRVSANDYDLEGNIFTIFRPLMEDFGIYGAGLFMILLGFISCYVFEKSIKGNISAIAIAIVLYTYLFHSVLLPITVHNSILLSFILPAILLKLITYKATENSHAVHFSNSTL